MAYICGERTRYTLFPKSVDEYVGKQDPVRGYDALVNELDFKGLGIEINSSKGGPKEYDPKVMLKIIIYGYSIGIRTSRKLEYACCRDISFMWLTGNLAPDYRTIARFRKDNRESIRYVLRETVRLCIKMGMIEGNVLFVDSTAVRADASIRKTFTPDRIKDCLKKIDKHIGKLMEESEKADDKEADFGSLVKVKEELLNYEKLKEKIHSVREELERESRRELNTTDKDSVVVKGEGGCRAGYRAQTTVDDKFGLIVNTDVVASATDANKLSEQVKKAAEVLERKPGVVVSDSGYCSAEDVAGIDEETKVIMPTQQLVNKERKGKRGAEADAFTKDCFVYDEKEDAYTCPEEKKLGFKFWSQTKTGSCLKNYRPESGSVCKACKHYGRCTNNSQGRKVTGHEPEKVREKLEAVYQSAEGQGIYRRRKIRSELPFAQIKHNKGMRRFLLRGVEGVNAEFALAATGHNVTRMITILGVLGLISRIQGG